MNSLELGNRKQKVIALYPENPVRRFVYSLHVSCDFPMVIGSYDLAVSPLFVYHLLNTKSSSLSLVWPLA